MSIGRLQEVRTMENYKTIRSKHGCGCLWKVLPCSMKILRVLIFANFVDWPRSAKIGSHRKKNLQNKMPQKLTPFSQIKNSAFNGLTVS